MSYDQKIAAFLKWLSFCLDEVLSTEFKHACRESLEVGGFFTETPDFETFMTHLSSLVDDVEHLRFDIRASFEEANWLPQQPLSVAASHYYIKFYLISQDADQARATWIWSKIKDYPGIDQIVADFNRQMQEAYAQYMSALEPKLIDP
jgi:hypothetical protein